MTKMVKYIVISDEYGRLVKTMTLEEFNPVEYMHHCDETCDEECEAGYFKGYMISIFEVPESAIQGMEDDRRHPSHYLNEHGTELTLGDYV
jgi:hypothetical protein